MKTFTSGSQRGSAFITTIGFVTIILLLIASVMKYALTERRMNNRSALLLESRLAAESISEYGVAQVKQILESSQGFISSTWDTDDQTQFTTGSYSGTVNPPPTAFWGGGHVVTSGANAPQMHIGNIMQEPVGLMFIDPANPDNANDPLKGKKVFNYNLDILTTATTTDVTGGPPVTKYWQQKFAMRAVPLFANAIYYNMDIELWPISAMTITGSVHTNGHLFVRGAGGAVSFAGAVTAVKGVWPKYADSTHAAPFMEWRSSETTTAPSYPGSTAVQILKAGTTTYKSLLLTATTTGFTPNLASGTWVESTWNLTGTAGGTGTTNWKGHMGYTGDPETTSDDVASVETAATKENYINWTQQAFNGNLLTHVNGISPQNLPGIPDYSAVYGSAYPDPGTAATSMAYTYDSSGNDQGNAAHALIERPLASSESHWVPAYESIKYSRQCSLYIVANTTGADATGHKPDGTQVTVPAGEYRAYMNNDGTISEVLLPGQDTYGGSPGTANPYTAHKNARPIVQMKQIPDYTTNVESATPWPGSARKMTDLRRTKGTTADTTFIHATARSATNTFVPKELRMIDIDMMELKKAVRLSALGIALGTTASSGDSTTPNGQGIFFATGPATTTGTNYPLGTTGTSGNWANHIYNPAGAQAATTLGDTNRIFIIPTTAGDATTMANAYTASIWNGGVYVESIAADAFDIDGGTAAIRRARTQNMRESGVRLVNGRGFAASNGTEGCTIATNDVLYVLGHFNADGLSTTPATLAVVLPPSPGASTGHNFEPDGHGTDTTTYEPPSSLVADSINVLSQPVFVNSSGTISQNNGWNDKFSSYYCSGTSATNWNSAWAISVPSATNTRDGTSNAAALGAALRPHIVPYDAGPGDLTAGGYASGTAAESVKKLKPLFTEYSAAFLCGLVPTGKDGVAQNSGGFHNFPHFLEDWYTGTQTDCRIRGSFVALFESRVHTEPWNGRFYSPPVRSFGFNLLFDTGAMPPLTPKTISPRRFGANDITKTTYNTYLTSWGYTPLP